MNINTPPIRCTCWLGTGGMGHGRQNVWLRWGPFTGRVVDAMLKAKAHPELAYRAVLGLTALQKKYGKERLEKASCVAWHYKTPDRRFIDNLLRNNRENQDLPLSSQSEQHSPASLEHENLRGPGYYH